MGEACLFPERYIESRFYIKATSNGKLKAVENGQLSDIFVNDKMLALKFYYHISARLFSRLSKFENFVSDPFVSSIVLPSINSYIQKEETKIQSIFDLPATEKILKHFKISCKFNFSYSNFDLYISQNYLLFLSITFGSQKQFTIALSDIFFLKKSETNLIIYFYDKQKESTVFIFKNNILLTFIDVLFNLALCQT